jgi:hypothetical protein
MHGTAAHRQGPGGLAIHDADGLVAHALPGARGCRRQRRRGRLLLPAGGVEGPPLVARPGALLPPCGIALRSAQRDILTGCKLVKLLQLGSILALHQHQAEVLQDDNMW